MNNDLKKIGMKKTTIIEIKYFKIPSSQEDLNLGSNQIITKTRAIKIKYFKLNIRRKLSLIIFSLSGSVLILIPDLIWLDKKLGLSMGIKKTTKLKIIGIIII
jgi:cobalamin-dependent methionine synthase I